MNDMYNLYVIIVQGIQTQVNAGPVYSSPLERFPGPLRFPKDVRLGGEKPN